MQYNFDQIVERRGTNSVKWDETKRIFGADVLPLWVADMDFPCPQPVVDALVERAKHPVFGYPGTPNSMFEAVAGWLKRRFDATIETSSFATVPGVVSGLHAAVEAFSKPGDKIVIQTPVYPPFYSTVRNLGRQVVENPLVEREDGSYAMNLEQLAGLIDSRTSMLIICSPHNPIGQLWTREELQTLAQICVDRGIILVSDEIHADLILYGEHVPVFKLSPEISNICLTFISPSKTFNIAGLFASIAIAENPAMMKRYKTTLENMSMQHLNLFGIEAMEAAYNEGDEWLEQVLAYLRGNAEYVSSFLKANLPKITMRVPEATYLGWIDFRALNLPQAELKRKVIEEAKLGFNDGMMFGKAGEGFQRINLGCARSVLEEAMARLEQTFAPIAK